MIGCLSRLSQVEMVPDIVVECVQGCNVEFDSFSQRLYCSAAYYPQSESKIIAEMKWAKRKYDFNINISLSMNPLSTLEPR